ncbi:hypothetical protein ACN47E_010282 [Coniothyrium glycines]
MPQAYYYSLLRFFITRHFHKSILLRATPFPTYPPFAQQITPTSPPHTSYYPTPSITFTVTPNTLMTTSDVGDEEMVRGTAVEGSMMSLRGEREEWQEGLAAIGGVGWGVSYGDDDGEQDREDAM